ncbi:hypothetical protein ACWEPC_43565, partial [Nonomuraea sp. NPDC004297]
MDETRPTITRTTWRLRDRCHIDRRLTVCRTAFETAPKRQCGWFSPAKRSLPAYAVRQQSDQRGGRLSCAAAHDSEVRDDLETRRRPGASAARVH